MKMQQMEQETKEFVNHELQAEYQELYQRIKTHKPFTEAEKKDLLEKKPEFYKMLQSLEHEIEICEQKLENCRCKEEIKSLKEEYQSEITFAWRSIESNLMLPLEKRLEYTMFRDTKISVIEDLIENFMQSAQYENLPEQAENAEEEKAEDTAEVSSGNAELYAKAKAGYEGFGLLSENEEELVFPSSSSFEAKG